MGCGPRSLFWLLRVDWGGAEDLGNGRSWCGEICAGPGRHSTMDFNLLLVNWNLKKGFFSAKEGLGRHRKQKRRKEEQGVVSTLATSWKHLSCSGRWWWGMKKSWRNEHIRVDVCCSRRDQECAWQVGPEDKWFPKAIRNARERGAATQPSRRGGTELGSLIILNTEGYCFDLSSCIDHAKNQNGVTLARIHITKLLIWPSEKSRLET
jgi:hypothetical protein